MSPRAVVLRLPVPHHSVEYGHTFFFFFFFCFFLILSKVEYCLSRLWEAWAVLQLVEVFMNRLNMIIDVFFV